MLTGLAGTGLSAVYVALKGLPGTRGRLPDSLMPPAWLEARPAALRAADGGGFGNRDESFARATSALEGRTSSLSASTAPTLVFPTAGEAARATKVTVPTVLATGDPALHLLRRTTFGPTPALVDEVHASGIDPWLDAQLAPETLADGEADGVWALYPRAAMAPEQVRRNVERYAWEAMAEYGRATLARQIWSTRQLYEVMVDLWANHLNVPMPSGPAWDVGVSYHNDVIRTHALGSFTDMLLAAMRHPAMLRYLSNDQSTRKAVNENLGRELLELHTIGVGSGYTETDVRNSAYILTGRTVANGKDNGAEGTFLYDPERHWTGPVAAAGFRHDNGDPGGGLALSDAYLRHLASLPATAHTIARKIAVRFVADDPPPELVERLAGAYLEGGTQIVPVLRLLFRSSEFWAAVGQKTRRPLENLAASARVLGVRPGPGTPKVVETWYWSAGKMGHRPLAWPAPNGYPDVRAAWRSSGGLLELWNRHRGLVHGWDEGVTYTPAGQLADGRPQATVGEYVDSLCQRLCFQTFQPHHRDVLAVFAGAGADTPTAQTRMDELVEHLAPLILDSPYFALR
ncbi:MAG: DUF1800 domain-containing protein [Acidimicrobiales bacterium]